MASVPEKTPAPHVVEGRLTGRAPAQGLELKIPMATLSPMQCRGSITPTPFTLETAMQERFSFAFLKIAAGVVRSIRLPLVPSAIGPCARKTYLPLLDPGHDRRSSRFER
jgi:hypothetical protein